MKVVCCRVCKDAGNGGVNGAASGGCCGAARGGGGGGCAGRVTIGARMPVEAGGNGSGAWVTVPVGPPVGVSPVWLGDMTCWGRALGQGKL